MPTVAGSIVPPRPQNASSQSRGATAAHEQIGTNAAASKGRRADRLIFDDGASAVAWHSPPGRIISLGASRHCAAVSGARLPAQRISRRGAGHAVPASRAAPRSARSNACAHCQLGSCLRLRARAGRSRCLQTSELIALRGLKAFPRSRQVLGSPRSPERRRPSSKVRTEAAGVGRPRKPCSLQSGPAPPERSAACRPTDAAWNERRCWPWRRPRKAGGRWRRVSNAPGAQQLRLGSRRSATCQLK